MREKFELGNGFKIPICSFLLVNVIRRKFCKDIVGKLSRVVQRLGSPCIFGLPSKEAKMVLFFLMLYGNTNHYVVVAQKLISLCCPQYLIDSNYYILFSWSVSLILHWLNYTKYS